MKILFNCISVVKTEVEEERSRKNWQKTQKRRLTCRWTHHSTGAAALRSSNHPRGTESPLTKSSSPTQSTLSSGQKILSLPSNTGSSSTCTGKDINAHAHTVMITESVHTDMKDLGSAKTFLNPQDVSRSLSCPGWYPSLFLKSREQGCSWGTVLDDVLEEVLAVLRG